VIAAPAGAAAPEVNINEIEAEVMCPVCGTLLELAESPQAQREKAFIARLIGEGKTKTEIKDALVAQYGNSVLALPQSSGFDSPLPGADHRLRPRRAGARLWRLPLAPLERPAGRPAARRPRPDRRGAGAARRRPRPLRPLATLADQDRAERARAEASRRGADLFALRPRRTPTAAPAARLGLGGDRRQPRVAVAERGPSRIRSS